MKSKDELQSLINNDPRIDCPYYFKMYYKKEYEECEKSGLLGELKFRFMKDPKYPVEYIQSIIDSDSEIKRPSDLEKKYENVYNFATHRKYLGLLKFNTRRPRVEYRSLQDVQDFVNKNNLTRREFREKHNTEYVYAQKYKYLDKLKFREPWTIDELQKIIDTEYLTKNQFREKHKEEAEYARIYKKMKFLKFFRNNPTIKLPKPIKTTIPKVKPINPHPGLWIPERYNPEYPDALSGKVKYMLEDIQKIIDEDPRVENNHDFKKLYKSEYWFAQRRGYLEYLKYRGPKFRPKYSIEDIQKIINEDSRINCRADLKEYYRSLYSFCIKYKYFDKLVFKTSGRKISRINRKLEQFFGNKGFIIEREKTFDWLKYNNPLFLDIFLPEYNVAIEGQGNQHFMALPGRNYVKTEEELLYVQTRDVFKYTKCKENNIKIFYFVNTEESYFDQIKDCVDNYFSYVYTDLDELYNDIIKLPKLEDL